MLATILERQPALIDDITIDMLKRRLTSSPDTNVSALFLLIYYNTGRPILKMILERKPALINDITLPMLQEQFTFGDHGAVCMFQRLNINTFTRNTLNKNPGLIQAITPKMLSQPHKYPGCKPISIIEALSHCQADMAILKLLATKNPVLGPVIAPYIEKP